MLAEARVNRLHAVLVLALLASASASGSAPIAPADAGPVLLVHVARWQGPDNTMITLRADGALQRLEGSNLIVRRQGSVAIRPDDAQALIDRAEALPDPQPASEAPVEGGRFLVVTLAGRVISAPEATAERDLRLLIDDILRAARAVGLQANRGHYVRTVPVAVQRAARLRDGGARAPGVDSLEPALRAVVEHGLRAPLRFHEVDQRTFAGVLAALGGRDAFVQAVDGTLHQVELWSPPE